MLTKAQLFNEAINLYWEHGIKFTMDELAARLCISKKTLYEMVRSKEDLTVQVVEYYFDGIAALQDAIHADVSLSAVQKLKKLLCATPDLPIRRYHLHELKMNFPAAFKLLDDRLRLGWERTFAVMDLASAEGALKNVDKPFFSKIYAAAIEDILMENEIDSALTFRQKQEQIVDMLLYGICK